MLFFSSYIVFFPCYSCFRQEKCDNFNISCQPFTCHIHFMSTLHMSYTFHVNPSHVIYISCQSFTCHIHFMSTLHMSYTFHVNPSHVIYISYSCPNYVYVAQHFSVDPKYSRYGPLRVHLDPVGKHYLRTMNTEWMDNI